MEAVRDLLLGPVGAVSNMFGRTETIQYRLHVITGDRRGAGTDANVYVVLYDIHGRASKPLASNKVFRNDNERGTTTTIDVTADEGLQGPITKVEVWRDNFADIKILGFISGAIFGQKSKRGSASWFLDRIEVEEVVPESKFTLADSDANGVLDEEENLEINDNIGEDPVTVHTAPGGGRVWVFPLQQWVAAHRRYAIRLHGCFLPQVDPDNERREAAIKEKRELYKYEQKVEGGPAQVNIAKRGREMASMVRLSFF